jgi:PIN domain nuclease of toxin-antitoxin system
MRVLLDTNVVLDLVLGVQALRPEVVAQLSDDATTIVISTVSPW